MITEPIIADQIDASRTLYSQRTLKNKQSTLVKRANQLAVAFRNQAVQHAVAENEELESASVSDLLDAAAEEIEQITDEEEDEADAEILAEENLESLAPAPQSELSKVIPLDVENAGAEDDGELGYTFLLEHPAANHAFFKLRTRSVSSSSGALPGSSSSCSASASPEPQVESPLIASQCGPSPDPLGVEMPRSRTSNRELKHVADRKNSPYSYVDAFRTWYG